MLSVLLKFCLSVGPLSWCLFIGPPSKLIHMTGGPTVFRKVDRSIYHMTGGPTVFRKVDRSIY